MVLEFVVGNVFVTDAKALVQCEEVGRGEQANACARLRQRRRRHRGGRAIAVGADNHRAPLAERREINAQPIPYQRHALKPRARAKLRIRDAPDPHRSAAAKLARQISAIRSQRPWSSSVAIMGLEFTSMTV